MKAKMKRLIKLSKILFLLTLIFFVEESSGQAGIYGQSVDLQDIQDKRNLLTENYNPSDSDGGLSGFWPGFNISWNILYDSASGLWNYEYTLQGDKEISHFILEITNPSFADEVLNPRVKIEDEGWTSWDINGPQYWGSDSKSNPGLPASLYGIKFDVGEEYVSYSFQTTKDPVWGNFYSKDGTMKQGRSHVPVYAYNKALGISGFESTDKLDFIPRPDGGSSVPMGPEPLSSILFVTGSMVLGCRRLFRKGG